MLLPDGLFENIRQTNAVSCQQQRMLLCTCPNEYSFTRGLSELPVATVIRYSDCTTSHKHGDGLSLRY